MFSKGTILIQGNNFTNNIATSLGGAIYFSSLSNNVQIDLVSNLFQGSRSIDGGTITVISMDSGSITLNGNNFTNSSATDFGMVRTIL